ncbi:hypothetical protein AS026_30720 [Rhizobium altiplani]|uniref:ChrB C-terminal domain-containing protein n=1 Tax=Rhizobium altiplani TaxID=1864509 RepID=A0A109JZH9_9HYPH|nr:hypothetical protein AS026_30720 [Rhizobium altiplani]
MFEGEITHEGDRCSFEVLRTRAGIADPALQAIAEIARHRLEGCEVRARGGGRNRQPDRRKSAPPIPRTTSGLRRAGRSSATSISISAPRAASMGQQQMYDTETFRHRETKPADVPSQGISFGEAEPFTKHAGLA